MLPGFNHNIKYQDRVYHIQTEDSGVRLAHVTTLLFIGGNVITSIKTSYADLQAEPDLNQRLLELMQTQHKAMLRALVSGRYDKEIAVRSQNAATLHGPAPINIEAGAQNRASEIVAPMGKITAEAPKAAAPPAPQKAAATAATAQANAPAAASAKAAAAKKSEGRSKPTHAEGNIASLAPILPAAKDSAGKKRGAAPRATSQDAPAQSGRAPSSADVIEGEHLRTAFAHNEEAVDASIFGHQASPKPLDEVILSYLANNKSSDK